ncbi:MAG: DUF4339 domain-containing protein [Verrucomicrobiales bacterium]
MDWFYEHQGQRVGPVTAAQLIRLRAVNQIGGQTLLWTPGGEIAQPYTVLAERLLSEELVEEENRATRVGPAQSSARDVRCVCCGELRPQSEMLTYGSHFVVPEHKEAFLARLQTASDMAPANCLDGRLRLGSCLRRGWRLFSSRFGLVFALFCSFEIPAVLLAALVRRLFVPADFVEAHPWLGFWVEMIPDSIAGALVATVGAGATAFVFEQTWQGRRAGYTGSVMASVHRYVSLAVATLVYNALTTLGGVAMIIPGIILGIRFGLYDFAIIVEKRGGLAGLHRSAELTNRKVFLVLAILLTAALPMLAITVLWLVLSSGLPFVVPAIGEWDKSRLASDLTWALITGPPTLFIMAVSFVIYKELSASLPARTWIPRKRAS